MKMWVRVLAPNPESPTQEACLYNYFDNEASKLINCGARGTLTYWLRYHLHLHSAPSLRAGVRGTGFDKIILFTQRAAARHPASAGCGVVVRGGLSEFWLR